MQKTVLVPIADGTEEIEAVCLIDTLRRAGASVTVASVTGLQVRASRGVQLVADCTITECANESYDLIVLPGGMPGAQNLNEDNTLRELLRRQHAEGGLIGAICAAPVVVLQSQGLLEGRRATAHPAFSNQLKDSDSVEQRVVIDGNCLTSRGPGTAIEFALACVELLLGQPTSERLAREMMVR